jgi:hypothetical protein
MYEKLSTVGRVMLWLLNNGHYVCLIPNCVSKDHKGCWNFKRIFLFPEGGEYFKDAVFWFYGVEWKDDSLERIQKEAVVA